MVEAAFVPPDTTQITEEVVPPLPVEVSADQVADGVVPAEVPTQEPPVGQDDGEFQTAQLSAKAQQVDDPELMKRLRPRSIEDLVKPTEDDPKLAARLKPVGDVPSTALEQAGAAAKGVLTGVTDAAGFIAGGVAGSRLPGPWQVKAGGAVVGAIGGALVSHLAQDRAKEVTIPGTDIKLLYGGNIKNLPADQRAFAIFGEAVGGSMAVAGAFRQLAMTGFRFADSVVGNFFNRMLDGAQQQGLKFMLAELMGGTGAGTGGGLAETFYPGSAVARITGEIGMGTFSPGRIMLFAYPLARSTFRKAWATFSSESRLNQAGETLRQMVEVAGEDVHKLNILLKEAGFIGVGAQTSAQKTGSPLLARMESALGAMKGMFKSDMLLRYREGLENIDAMIKALRGTGDPAALGNAAELEVLAFRTTHDLEVSGAAARALREAAEISSVGAEGRAAYGVLMKNLIVDIMKKARGAEEDLWKRIDGDIMVDITATLDQWHILSSKLALTNRKLPKEIEGFIQKQLEEGATGKVSMETAIEIRKQWLELARDAAGSTGVNSTQLARWYGSMGESIIESMDATFGNPGEGLNRFLGLSADAYHTARAYSRSFNDAMTRTFAGTVMAKKTNGAYTIPPEVLAHRALAGGADAGRLRMQEMKEAAEFLTHQQYIDIAGADGVASSMMDIQENLLRIAATKFVSANTDRVSTHSMQNFMKEWKGLLDDFPHLQAELKQAIKSEEHLQSMVAFGSGKGELPLAQTAEGIRHAAFERVADLENSVIAVTRAFNSNNPQREFKRLLELVDGPKGGYLAKEGLRSSVLDMAFDMARQEKGGISYTTLRRVLFEEIQPGSNRTIMQVMLDSGVMDPADQVRMLRLLDEADKIVGTQGAHVIAGGMEKVVDPAPDFFFGLIARGLGAFAATQGARRIGIKGSGPSLVIAAGGARGATMLAERIPNTKIQELFIQAALDPKFMAMLMKRGKDPKAMIDINLQLHAYLIRTGIIPVKSGAELYEDYDYAQGKPKVDQVTGEVDYRQGQ